MSITEKSRREKKRRYLRKLKAIEYKGGHCKACGEDRLVALCFHHREPSDKGFPLNVANLSMYGWDKVEAELDKCDLLCHNCHHVLHYQDGWDQFLAAAQV